MLKNILLIIKSLSISSLLIIKYFVVHKVLFCFKVTSPLFHFDLEWTFDAKA